MENSGSEQQARARMKSKAHMERVAQLPCVCCGAEGVQVHHAKISGLCGMGQKASDWFVMPLCPSHHAEFHHNGKESWQMRHGSQVDHVVNTLDRLYG